MCSDDFPEPLPVLNRKSVGSSPASDSSSGIAKQEQVLDNWCISYFLLDATRFDMEVLDIRIA